MVIFVAGVTVASVKWGGGVTVTGVIVAGGKCRTT